MLLETLTDANDFEIEWDEMSQEIMSGDFGISTTETLISVTEYFERLKLITIEDGKLFSNKLKERLNPVIEKRRRAEESYNLRKKEQLISKQLISDTENTVSVTETTQSKVKESKVNKSKGEIESEPAPIKRVYPTPESLFDFASAVFSDEIRLSGAKNMYEVSKMAFSSDVFSQLLRNWSAYQIENEKPNFNEKTLYASVLRWIGNQKQFEIKPKNGSSPPKGTRPQPTEFVPFTSFT